MKLILYCTSSVEYLLTLDNDPIMTSNKPNSIDIGLYEHQQNL